MRISVYCADQTAYHNEKILQQQYSVYPYLKGYPINDAYQAMYDCWRVPPVRPETKQPFYSNTPVLLADGELDNTCHPMYMDLIHQYMPNSQRLLFRNRSHMVGWGTWNLSWCRFWKIPTGNWSRLSRMCSCLNTNAFVPHPEGKAYGPHSFLQKK